MAKEPDPEDESLAELFAAMSITKFEVGHHFFANATHIMDPHNFYVVPLPHAHHLSPLNKAGEPCQEDKTKVGQTVIYMSQALNRNIRGVVQHTEDGKFWIYALDYGFMERNVPMVRMFLPFNKESTTIPSLVHYCQLDMCYPKGNSFSDDAIDAFRFFISNDKLQVIIRGKTAGKFRVSVLNSERNDIATMMALSHYTYLSNGQYTTPLSRYMTPALPAPLKFVHQDLKEGEVLKVRVQSAGSGNSFYVTTIQSYTLYLKNRSEFNAYCKSVPQITPSEFVPGAIVGVIEIDLYERAIILEITASNAKAKVRLVDWGKVIEVSISKTVAIKSQVYTLTPVHALYCATHQKFMGSESNPLSFLKKGYCLTMTVQHVGNGFEAPHIVTLAPV